MAFISYSGVNNYMPMRQAAHDGPSFLDMSALTQGIGARADAAMMQGIMNRFLKEDEPEEVSELEQLQIDALKEEIFNNRSGLMTDYIDNLPKDQRENIDFDGVVRMFAGDADEAMLGRYGARVKGYNPVWAKETTNATKPAFTPFDQLGEVERSIIYDAYSDDYDKASMIYKNYENLFQRFAPEPVDESTPGYVGPLSSDIGPGQETTPSAPSTGVPPLIAAPVDGAPISDNQYGPTIRDTNPRAFDYYNGFLGLAIPDMKTMSRAENLHDQYFKPKINMPYSPVSPFTLR